MEHKLQYTITWTDAYAINVIGVMGGLKCTYWHAVNQNDGR